MKKFFYRYRYGFAVVWSLSGLLMSKAGVPVNLILFIAIVCFFVWSIKYLPQIGAAMCELEKLSK